MAKSRKRKQAMNRAYGQRKRVKRRAEMRPRKRGKRETPRGKRQSFRLPQPMGLFTNKIFNLTAYISRQERTRQKTG